MAVAETIANKTTTNTVDFINIYYEKNRKTNNSQFIYTIIF